MVAAVANLRQGIGQTLIVTKKEIEAAVRAAGA
jgi:hypothetical protein